MKKAIIILLIFFSLNFVSSVNCSIFQNPNSWEDEYEGNYYFFPGDNKTWFEANASCASHDSHLVVINNLQENNFLKNNFARESWIGLYQGNKTANNSHNGWLWVDGTQITFSNWHTNEPNDYYLVSNQISNNTTGFAQCYGFGTNEGCAEDCAQLSHGGTSGKWNDFNCVYAGGATESPPVITRLPYVCEVSVQTISGQLYYPDLDGDGYGNSTLEGQCLESPPASYINNSMDCDDFNNLLNVQQGCVLECNYSILDKEYNLCETEDKLVKTYNATDASCNPFQKNVTLLCPNEQVKLPFFNLTNFIFSLLGIFAVYFFFSKSGKFK